MQNITFTIIIFLSVFLINTAVLMLFSKKKKMTDRIQNKDENVEQNKIKSKKNAMDKFEEELKNANIKMGANFFIMIVFILTVALFLGTYAIFKTPIVAIGPLPFTLYFIPRTILDMKKNKKLEVFEGELVQILRRMSSVIKNGSILQALEEVKDMSSISEQSRFMLNEVYHLHRYGSSIDQAFKEVAEKSGSKQFKLCAISIEHNKELGSDLSENLNNISIDIQRRRMMEMEAKSLMGQTLAMGQILSLAPFGIIASIASMNPEYFDVYLKTLSHQLTFLALIFVMLFGVYFINRQSNK